MAATQLGTDLPTWSAPTSSSCSAASTPDSIGELGQHFARPGNRFWKLLHAGGFTDRPYYARRSNRCSRAWASASPTSWPAPPRPASSVPKRFDRAPNNLEQTAQLRPRCVAVLGLQAYRTGFETASTGHRATGTPRRNPGLATPQPERAAGQVPTARNDGDVCRALPLRGECFDGRAGAHEVAIPIGLIDPRHRRPVLPSRFARREYGLTPLIGPIPGLHQCRCSVRGST